MAFPRKKRLSAEDSAARVFSVFAENAGSTMHIRRLAKLTNMSINQVRNGERHLKAFFNEHRDELPDWTLHISLSNLSEHGIINDPDRAFLDAVSRLLYMSTRAVSETDYREQQIDRVQDPIVKKHLRRGINYQRAARDAFADAYEHIAK